MMSTRRKQALGKGLGALLATHTAEGTHESNLSIIDPGAVPIASPASQEKEATATNNGELRYVSPTNIIPNPHQPRENFNEEKLTELADSIRAHGVLQPLLVCLGDSPDQFVLLAGERRLRASQLAEQEKIPVRVVPANDHQKLEIAIIENVQRDDLNPVEEAHAYQELASAFHYSQEEIAKRVGKSRVAVANSLRLLKLPENCLCDLQNSLLTAGHARAILMLHHPLQQEQLRREILDGELSVREAEGRAKAIQLGEDRVAGKKGEKKTSPEKQQNLDVVSLEEKLTLHTGCKVRLKPRTPSTGALEIQYQNLDDLDRFFELLGFQAE